MFLNGGDALSGLGDAEGEHGEVVVLLGAVAELVGVGLEGLDDVARALRSDGSKVLNRAFQTEPTEYRYIGQLFGLFP